MIQSYSIEYVNNLVAENRQLKFENEFMVEALHEEGIVIEFPDLPSTDKAPVLSETTT